MVSKLEEIGVSKHPLLISKGPSAQAIALKLWTSFRTTLLLGVATLMLIW